MFIIFLMSSFVFVLLLFLIFFFFNDTATTEIYTLSLHDALPILLQLHPGVHRRHHVGVEHGGGASAAALALLDRKSTRLNSSHMSISYAVFCLKKKKINIPFKYLMFLTLIKPSLVLFLVI